MLTQFTDRIPPLSILIPVLMVAWAGSCAIAHGPAIFAYIALQGATSGIFALSMYKISRRFTHDDPKPAGQAVDGNSPSAQSSDQHATA
jgi:hypothetical protein